jgi:hypothetical protein
MHSQRRSTSGGSSLESVRVGTVGFEMCVQGGRKGPRSECPTRRSELGWRQNDQSRRGVSTHPELVAGPRVVQRAPLRVSQLRRATLRGLRLIRSSCSGVGGSGSGGGGSGDACCLTFGGQRTPRSGVGPGGRLLLSVLFYSLSLCRQRAPFGGVAGLRRRRRLGVRLAPILRSHTTVGDGARSSSPSERSAAGAADGGCEVCGRGRG